MKEYMMSTYIAVQIWRYVFGVTPDTVLIRSIVVNSYGEVYTMTGVLEELLGHLSADGQSFTIAEVKGGIRNGQTLAIKSLDTSE